MTPKDPRRDRTDDLSWATPPPLQQDRRCWICRRPNASAWRLLGPPTESGGTKVPYCAEGVGCRDGRIYHGPQANPHWPGDPCDYCTQHGEPNTGRRVGGNRAKPVRRSSNLSDRHR